MINKRLQTIILILLMAIIALAGLLLLMAHLATPPVDHAERSTPTVSPLPVVTASPATTADIVATVNHTTISRTDWEQTTRLDAVMSQLAYQPIPTVEETLDRMVNEILVLDAVEPIPPPTESEVKDRVAALSSAWKAAAPAITNALTTAGLSETDLSRRVARLIQVEIALKQLAAQQDDLNAWLLQARASAEISLYRSLAMAAELPPTPAPTEIAAEIPAAGEPTTTPGVIPDLPVAPFPENLAPPFSLNRLDGEAMALANLRGKPAIINFWATWCPPCRRELPALQGAYEKYAGQVGFVAVDVKEEAAAVSAFVNELGLTFPVAIDPDGQVSDIAYQVRGIPTTFFVDADGVVKARHVGPLDEAAIEAYLTPLLEESLAETPDNGDPVPVMVNQALADSLPQLVEGSGPPTPPAALLPVKPAPDFTLPAAGGSMVALQDYVSHGNVVLVFYRGHT